LQPGTAAAIQVLMDGEAKTGMPGSRPGMTVWYGAILG
jgi:hypothetical protein